MALKAGQIFAGYEILRELGRGGMGAVYEARQLALQRIVALKILPPHLAGEEGFVARFQSEAIAAANVNHANIVQVFTAGESEGIEYIAMEFIEGETIQHRLKRLGRLPLTEALDIAYHVATALDHAWHTTQLIHRDVKPDNIFLAHNGTVKLGDFGLAKILREGATSATVTGIVLGSAHFMSPEQARGARDLDARTDIYSLGCTLHYMMTGRTVFEGPDFLSVMYKHVNEAPAPLQTFLPHCPLGVNRLLTRMLAKEREQRPQSYAELIEEIVHARDEARVWEQSDERQRRRMARPQPPRRPSRWAYAMAMVAVVVLAASYVYGRRAERPNRAPTSLMLSDPSDRRDFIRRVENLPADERIERVMATLREANPNFVGQEDYSVKGGVVTELTLPSVGLQNLWPLCALQHLSVLNIVGNPAARRRGTVTDLSALAELPLEELDISWTAVEDLRPLVKTPLKTLRAANTRLRDLTPLRGLQLTELDLTFTEVADLSPLKGMPLTELRLKDAKVRDLSPLKGMPLQTVSFDVRLLRPQSDTVRSWKELETINDEPVRNFENRLQPARRNP
jgi:serine/threonine protein kinase